MPAFAAPGILEIIIIGLVVLIPLALVVALAIVIVLGRTRNPAGSSNPNLGPCPDCGRFVSRRATACPQCGCPLQAE